MKRILSFLLLIILIITMFPMSAFASSDEDDYYLSGEDIIGSILASLGYYLDGTVLNGVGVSNILNMVADNLMDDPTKQAIAKNYGFSSWADAVENPSADMSNDILQNLYDDQKIIIDNQNNQIKVTEDLVSIIQDFMSSEYVPSYFMLHVPYFGDFPNGNADQASVIESYYNSASENNTLLGVYQPYLDERFLTIDLYAPSCIDNTVLVCPNDETYLDLLKNSDSYYNQFRRNANVTNNFSYSIYCYDSRTFAYNYLVQPSKRVNTNGTTSYVPPEGYPFCDSSKSINNSSYYYSIRFYSSSRSSTYYFVANHDIYIPLFRNVAEARLYASGDSDIYIYPSGYSGGDLTVSTDLDYDALNKEIRNAIKKSGLTSPMDIQRVINTTVTEWLKKIEHNTDDIVDNTKETNNILNKILEEMKAGFSKSLDKLNDIKSSLSAAKTSLSDILNYLKSGKLGSGTSVINPEDMPDSFLNIQIPITFTEYIGKDADGNELFEETTTSQTLAKWIDEINTTKFPFSITNNYKTIFEMFQAAPAEAPKIHIQLSGSAPEDIPDDVILLSSNNEDSVSDSNISNFSLGNLGFDITFEFIDPIMPAIRLLELLLFALSLGALTVKFVAFMGDFL